MLKTRVARETVVRVPNEIGMLDDMAKQIAEKGIDVLAVTAWVEGADAVFRLLTDDDVRVADALKAWGHEVRPADVLVMELPHKPGMLHHVADALAQEGIDIHHLYATATTGQDRCLMVLGTANNERAVVLLNTEAGS